MMSFMVRPRRGVLAPLLLFAAGCARGLPPLPMPLGLAPASRDAAVRWAAATRPADNRDLRFHWKFQDEQGSAGGRGRGRLALPDSIRFDVAGPLGSGHASALVIGDSAIWTEPEEEIRKLVPNYPLFWAMLGIVRAPDPGSSVRSFSDDRVTAWQFAAGEDTVEYVRENGPEPRLLAEVRQAGHRVGRVETKFGANGLPASSRLVVPKPASKLDLTFNQNAKAAPFAPDTWLRPSAAQP